MALISTLSNDNLSFQESGSLKAKLVASETAFTIQKGDGSAMPLKNVQNPSDANDAATKAYVDAKVSGVSVKEEVGVAISSNVSGTYSNGVLTTNINSNLAWMIDGVSVPTGLRILLIGQTDASQNGVYVASPSVNFKRVLTRASDFASSKDFSGSEFVFVTKGTTFANMGFVHSGSTAATVIGDVTVTAGNATVTGSSSQFTTDLSVGQSIRIDDLSYNVASITNNSTLTLSSPAPSSFSGKATKGIILGTDDITFSQFSGAGQITAGAALEKTGNTLDVKVDNTTLQVSSDALQIRSGGVGSSHLATNSVNSLAIASNAITETHITNSSVTNVKLANSHIQMIAGSGLSGGGSVSLGGTSTLNMNTDNTSLEISSDTLQVKAGGITNSHLSGSIENSKLTNSTISGVSLGGTLSSHVIGVSSTHGLNISSTDSYNGSSGVTQTLSLAQDIRATASPSFSTITANNGMVVKNSTSSSPGKIEIFESSDNGTNKATIQAQPNMASNLTYTLPSTSGTLATTAFVNGELGAQSIVFNAQHPTHFGSGDQTKTVSLGETISIYTEYDNSTIGLNSSNELEIKTSGVGASQLAANAVTTAKLASSAVTNAKLANSTISGHELGTTLSTYTVGVGGTNGLTITSGTYDGSGNVSQTIDLPQNLKTNATPTFQGATMNGALVVKNGVNPGAVTFFEGSATGSQSVVLKCESNILSNQTLTLPSNTGTLISTGSTFAITTAMIANGAVANNKLLNPSFDVASADGTITFDSSSVTLGGAVDVKVSTGSITNSQINGSAAIDVSKLSASTISGKTLGGNLDGHTVTVSGNDGLSIISVGGSTYNGSSSVTQTLSLPQDLRTSASPTFVEIQATSCATMKRNITRFEDDTLAKLDQIEAKRFQWNEDIAPDAGERIGIIAQDIERIYPECIKTDEFGRKSVNTLSLVAVLLNAVKQLSQRQN